MLPGFCLVVSPLIALMQDQVERLKKQKIPSVALHAGMSKRGLEVEYENLVNGKYKLVYCSPERIQSQLFNRYLGRFNISFIAVDEAHCISQWGYDFRPAYLNISQIREFKPDIAVMALTASATPEVKDDIVLNLKLKECRTHFTTFNRTNLHYKVVESGNKRQEIVELYRRVKQSGLVYVNSRGLAADLSAWLLEENVSCSFYHAGLAAEVRASRQQQWLDGHIHVMVCTNAFGMGIDKASVRFVVHYAPPTSLEAYYQEAGRAGRDGKDAICMLFCTQNDLTRAKIQLAEEHPDIKQLQKLYESVCNFLSIALNGGKDHQYDFDLQAFCRHFDYAAKEVFYGIKQLEMLGYILQLDAVNLTSGVKFEQNAAALYQIQLKNEKFEPLIKHLLRTKGGILDRMVAIDEKATAKSVGLMKSEVVVQLEKLQKQGILTYAKVSGLPRLLFVHERVQKVRDVEGRLARLKQGAESRMDAVRSYIESERCRSAFICNYFGEQSPENCGKCDVCLVRMRNQFPMERFELLAQNIKEGLGGLPIALSDFLKELEIEELEDYKLVLRWLMDEGVIKSDQNKKLYWSR